MFTHIDEATHEFEVSVEEACAENPDVNPDDVAHDMIFSTAMNCNKATAFELCRRQLGFVTEDVKNFFAGTVRTLDSTPEPWLWDEEQL